MTLAVAVAVRDAIVLAADSRMSGGGRVQSDSVDKIIPLNDHLAVATSGDAYIGDMPLRDIVLALAQDGPETVEEAAANLRDKLMELVPLLNPCPIFSLIVVGYNPNQTGHIYRLHFPGGLMVAEGSTQTMGIATIGQSLAVQRLISGYDPRLRYLLSEYLPVLNANHHPDGASTAENETAAASDSNIVTTENGNAVTVPPAQPADRSPPPLVEILGKYNWYLGLSHYTTQDAIDLCDYLMQVTIGAQRFVFLDGRPVDNPQVMSQGVGGPVDILVLTRHGSGWHRKKPTYLP